MEMFSAGLVELTGLQGHGPGSCLLHDLIFRPFSGHIKQTSFHDLLPRMCRQIITSIFKDCRFSPFRESCLLQEELSSSVPAYSKHIKLSCKHIKLSSLHFYNLLIFHSFSHQTYTNFLFLRQHFVSWSSVNNYVHHFITVYSDILCSCKQCLIYKMWLKNVQKGAEFMPADGSKSILSQISDYFAETCSSELQLVML